MVKELSKVDLEKDIIVNMRPLYGTKGNITCTVLGLNNDSEKVFTIELDNIKKNEKATISKGLFNSLDKNFICLYGDIKPDNNKSKKEVQVTLLQGKTKMGKVAINDDISNTIFRIL